MGHPEHGGVERVGDPPSREAAVESSPPLQWRDIVRRDVKSQCPDLRASTAVFAATSAGSPDCDIRPA
jgi:hypothetical protein